MESTNQRDSSPWDNAHFHDQTQEFHSDYHPKTWVFPVWEDVDRRYCRGCGGFLFRKMIGWKGLRWLVKGRKRKGIGSLGNKGGFKGYFPCGSFKHRLWHTITEGRSVGNGLWIFNESEAIGESNLRQWILSATALQKTFWVWSWGSFHVIFRLEFHNW